VPIKIDLLADARDLEEARHKNPLKRAIWIAGFFVFLVLLWMLKLGGDIYFAHEDYSRIRERSADISAQYADATNNQVEIIKADYKINSLNQLSTNRFFWAPVLSALERSTVNDIRVTRVSGTQTYTQDSRAVPPGSGKADTPGCIVEKISLNIQAVDTSPNERATSKYKDSLNNCDYFSNILKQRDDFVLGDVLRLPATTAPDQPRQPVTFVLIAHFPEVRHVQ
jgi:hypothetical protein